MSIEIAAGAVGGALETNAIAVHVLGCASACACAKT